MVNKLDLGDRLLAGVILTIVGLVGLAYRSMDYSIIMGDLTGYHTFYGSGYTVVGLITIALFIIVVLLGIYIVYDTIKKDSQNWNKDENPPKTI